MATGGYKCVQFQWTGGRTDTVLERLNFVLSGIVEAIINSGTGWALDNVESGQTTSDWYHELSCTSGKAIVKFIYNSTASVRLAIGMSSGSDITTTAIPTEDRMKNSASGTSQYVQPNGIFMSVSHTAYTWGISSGAISLEPEATRWISACMTPTSNSSGGFIAENQYTYTYNIILKNGQIALLYRSSNWNSGLYKGYIIGRIFGTLAHPEDGNEESDFGCAILGYNPSGSGTESSQPSTSVDVINKETTYFSISNYNCFFRSFEEEEFEPDNICAYSYGDGANVLTNISIANTVQLGTNVANPEAGTGGRWCPLQAFITSLDPSLYGIVEGDGFKGYLDTDFIRGVTINTYSKGQTFGTNAEFIYLGGGIAIGWDSTNTVSLF